MAKPVTKVHDKYKEMLITWGLEKDCVVSTIQMSIDDLIDMVDEFERLKEHYTMLKISRGTYGFRDNY